MELDKKTFLVKWNKDEFQVQISSNSIVELRKQIEAKTKVEASRQKIIHKGKVLQDTDLSPYPNKSILTLRGAASENLIKSDQSSIKFIEDLSKEERIQMLRDKGEEVLFGLQNLGNTCYFNSVFQCLGRVDPLRKGLKALSSQGSSNSDLSKILAVEMGRTYDQLDKASDTVVPHGVINVLRNINPAFAEADRGVYKQQDADECFGLLLEQIKRHLKAEGDDTFGESLIDDLFGIETAVSLTNAEDSTEVKTKKETLNKLVCYIDNNTTELVNGLKSSQKEHIDLYSDKLLRNCVFEKQQLLNRIPQFLTIQFMRFFWKPADDDIPGSKAGKAKILKSILFSKIIDIYDLCTKETQEVLNLGRDIETKVLKDDKEYRTDMECERKGENMVPTGRYQLIAVVTHQGRSSESGHYIGWVHKKGDKWTKFDDDNVSTVNTNEILELKGGGDWHMAYICIYKRLEIAFEG